MEDVQRFWRLREWLTIHEAASLACGLDPAIIYEADPEKTGVLVYELGQTVKTIPPQDYQAFFGGLKEAVEFSFEEYSACLEGIIGHENIAFKPTLDSDLVMRSQQTITGETKVKVGEIKEWLLSKDLTPEFFFPEKDIELSKRFFDLPALKNFIEASGTEDEQEFDQNSLSFLQKREWLSIDEIAGLVCGRDPQVFYTNDVNEALVMKEAGHEVYVGVPDDGYDDFFKVLVESLEFDLETQSANDFFIRNIGFTSNTPVNLEEDVEAAAEENQKLIFTIPETVKGCKTPNEEEAFHLSNVNEIRVKVLAIKKWLRNKKIKAPFFFPKEDENFQQAETKEPAQNKPRSPSYTSPEDIKKQKKETTSNKQKLSKQEEREQVLERLITDKGLDDLVPLKRIGVWEELTKIDKDLFPFRENPKDSTVKKFFGNQSLISFGRGR